ncbi:MAG: AAA family ATPase [bacterium]|nr:AAA family ATPase [bacterium]
MPRALGDEVWELIRAGFSGIWVETHEASEAILELAALGAEQGLRILVWNLDSGLRSLGSSEASADSALDPLSALRSLQAIEGDASTVLILENFHRFLDSPEICQAMLTQLQLGKQFGRHVVILAPLVKLPRELERQFAVLTHALPDREQLWQIADSLLEDDQYSESEKVTLLDAAIGLTRLEAESAFSLSLVRHGRLTSQEIWQLKSRWLEKSGVLQLHRPEFGFDALGGLANLKQFCSHSLRRQAHGKARPRGVMLLGVPGTGKSAFAKALGKESDRPVLALDVGQLMGSLVGQTEANIRSALQTADAMAPAILFIDEVEKALSGVASGGRGDSGVSSRLFGTLLTWLNDHSSDVYVVVTCNNIQQLPPEFSRAERFDAIMFLDLPSREEKDAIWRLYRQHYAIETDQSLPADEQWTGAEIKACCRLACLLGVSLEEASRYIVPVGVTAAEDIGRLRSWANGRCLDASRQGVFRSAESKSAAGRRPKRGVTLRPSDN